jgi:alpha-1,6-mannosyltransferase
MRICDLTTLYLDGAQGGVNTYLTEKARHFGHHPDVSQHTIIVPGRRDEVRQLLGSTIHVVKSPPMPSNPQHRVLARFGEVQRLLRTIEPSVVEVDCAYFLAEATRALPTIPIIGCYHVHLPALVGSSWISGLGSTATHTVERLAWRYLGFCLRRCDRIVVTSLAIRQQLEAAGLAGLEHIPLGVNLELFSPLRRTHARTDGAPIELLYVGRLSPEKNVARLIEAYSLLPSQRFRLTIVGDGPCERALQRQAAHFAGIHFLGSLPYGELLADRYAAADLFVSPGHRETFNLTLLEALASGLPVVCAAGGSSRELIHADSGAVVCDDSPQALAQQIELVSAKLSGPTQRRGPVEQYTWSRTFEGLLALYRDAIASRAGRQRREQRTQDSCRQILRAIER